MSDIIITTGASIIGIVLIVVIKWVVAIDNMKNLHPDYKGEDFL